MNKEEILQFIYQLQETRDNIDNIMYFSALPIEHLPVNFNKGIDLALEAVLALYGEIILNEIQRKKEVRHES